MSRDELEKLANDSGLTANEIAEFLEGVVDERPRISYRPAGTTSVPAAEVKGFARELGMTEEAFDEFCLDAVRAEPPTVRAEPVQVSEELARMAEESGMSPEELKKFFDTAVCDGDVEDRFIPGTHVTIPGRNACLLLSLASLVQKMVAAKGVSDDDQRILMGEIISREQWGKTLDLITHGGQLLNLLSAFEFGAAVVLLRTTIGGVVQEGPPLVLKNQCFDPEDKENDNIAAVMYSADENGENGHYMGIDEDQLKTMFGFDRGVLKYLVE